MTSELNINLKNKISKFTKIFFILKVNVTRQIYISFLEIPFSIESYKSNQNRTLYSNYLFLINNVRHQNNILL